jgi:hypothetical protein
LNRKSAKIIPKIDEALARGQSLTPGVCMPPRTIDNLGVEVSTRYAEDKQILDETLVKESRSIPMQTEIMVTAPSFSSEMEALLHGQLTHITWASFIAPAYYFEQRKRLFTYQLIPSMGSDDKKESQALKILSKLHSLSDEYDQEKKDKRQQYEEEKALEEGEREKKILTSLLNTIAFFDKLIIEINSRKSQYQKG